MTTHQANLEARHAALLAAAECADNSAADLLAIAAALRQQAEKLGAVISPHANQPKIAQPHKTPSVLNSNPHPVECHR